MGHKNTFTPRELNEIIRCHSSISDLPSPKKWQRVDCGETEVYVGDKLFIVALVEKILGNDTEIEAFQLKTQETVIRYLQSEGFIDEEYAYVGMQRFELKNEPDS
jgi:hypothetical protein